MTFADKALQSASERFFLVKITSRRYLYLGQLSAPNTYVYTVPENLKIESIIINGSAISSSNYVYLNDQLQITSTLNLQSTANVVTLDHNIFLTATKWRETSGVSGLPDAQWEPLIENYPNFNQSMSNIAEGVFTLSNTNISFICTDRWAQNLVGKPEFATGQYESLSNSPVSVWVCIDDVTNNRKIFDGEIVSASYNNGIFNISIIDTFQKLTNTASFGTRSQSYIYTGNGTQFTKPEDENFAVSITMGQTSPIKIAPGYKQVDPFDTTPIFGTSSPLYHLSDGKVAKLIGPQNANQNSTTTWHAGRIAGTDIKKINFGNTVGNTLTVRLKREVKNTTTIEIPALGESFPDIQDFTLINHLIFVQLENINNFTGQIGDYIPDDYLPRGSVPELSGANGYICAFGPNIYLNYNLVIATDKTAIKDGLAVNYPNVTSTKLSLPNNLLPSMSVWIESGDTADYKFDSKEIFTAGTSVYIIIDKSNFSTRYLPFTYSLGAAYTIGSQTVRDVYITLDPNSKVNIADSTIKCRMSPNQSMTHGNALKLIVKASGMQTNDASFAQADIDLPANVSVTYPLSDGGDFEPYLNAAQSITNSTLGLLRVNQGREVEYKIIKNPEALPASSIRNSVNMINGRTQSSIEYQDIVSSVQFENPQLKILNNQAEAVVDLPIAKQVHRIDKTKKISHVLENIQSRKNAIAGYFASPTVEYNLATASEDLASSIGDIIEINNTAVADKNQTTKGVIVSLDQSGSTTSIKINEIRGVE